jgi:transcriptional regulator with GAF, ATPase, and Fis domain
MATVFLALDEPRRAQVVIKQLGAARPDLLGAFQSEFSLLASLTHPHLAQVHDFGTVNLRGEALYYYAAEWVEGTTLYDHALRARDERWLRPLIDAVLGLLALHELGIVHGDLTPHNILVRTDGSGVLIDLGCARPAGHVSDSVSGTPGFMAPELLASGQSDMPADVYAIGATLARLHQLSGVQPSPSRAELVTRLLSTDPRQRPSDVHGVLSALGCRAPGAFALRARCLRLVGRDAERAQLSAFLDALRSGRASSRVLLLGGARGLGKSRLLRELLAEAELGLDVVRAHGSEPSAVQWLLGAAIHADEGFLGARAALAAVESLNERSGPLLLALEDSEQLNLAQAELLLQFARSLEDSGKVGLIITGVDPPPLPNALRIELGPLDMDALRQWTEHSLSDSTLSELLGNTQGVPARIEAALSHWASARERPGPAAITARSGASQAGSAAFSPATLLAPLSPGELQKLALLLALSGELETRDWALTLQDFAFGFSSQLLDRERTRVRLSPLVDQTALRGALGPELLRASHRQIATALAATGPAAAMGEREAEIIRHLILAGAVAEAAERLAIAAPVWRSEPRPFSTRLAELALAWLPAECLLAFAEMALIVGEPRRVLSLVARILRARPQAPSASRARILGADALTRLGRGARAERAMQRLLREEQDTELRALGLERLARARVQRGDYSGASDAAEQGLALAEPARMASLREALGVATLYAGQLAEAEAYFSEVLAGLGPEATARDRCRVLGYRAIAAFRAGHPDRARDDHARALDLAELTGLDDLVGVCSLNLGTALQQLGDLGGAFERYARGLAITRALGRESTELVLLYNRLNIQIELGELAPIEADLVNLERRAEQARLLHFAPAIALVRAEIAQRTRDRARAHAQLDRAEAGYAELGLTREGVEVGLCRAELEIEEGALDAAEERLLWAKQRSSEQGALDLRLRGELLLGRLSAARGDAAAIAGLGAALALADKSGSLLLAAKIQNELWICSDRLQLPGADAHAEAAIRRWDRVAAQLTEAQREVFWSDQRRARLLTRARREGTQVRAPGVEAQALARLLSLSRRINSSLSLEHVLKYAVDAAVELSAAERGFLLLAEGPDQPVTLRASSEPFAVPSRTVVDRVLASGQPLITTDAESDARLSGQRSVHAQRLKAVLCVPIASPSELLGVLYVDSRIHRAQLTPAARDLLLALADQVAVALSNARLHSALERRSQELAAEKQTVLRLAQGQDRELKRLREQLESQRQVLELRYDYSQIIGRGPSMRAVLSELDRIIEADASVLIQGESGTGKELIARAIHVHGSRKAGPFVGVNCAALPEALLESELFGHVRGAFTGADRDKAGLMLAARGGTLFLDELGELPLAMQAKLLRVLQEREVRPLGSERSLPLDVRLVCATHKDLAEEAAAGRFRQDLFYRIAVVVVRLPPLRERIEDLPELSRNILARLAQEAGRDAPELGRDALRALSAHAFAGNVRELENILTRAFVLSSGARLGAADLNLEERARPQQATNREAFASEERLRILDALQRTRWNVSVVSRSLGIPRNTLYRKLERYGLKRDDQ